MEINGKIQVTVQEHDRLSAITELAQAVNKLASALLTGVVVNISGCQFDGTGGGTGISIDTQPDVTETMIQEIGND